MPWPQNSDEFFGKDLSVYSSPAPSEYLALCAELSFIWGRSTNPDDLFENMIPLVDRARTALAQPEHSSDGGLTVSLRMDLSSECLKRLCDGLAAAVKPNGGYREITTDDDIASGFTGDQQVGVMWWLPEHGCDSLENTLDAIKSRLLVAVRNWLPTAVAATTTIQPEPVGVTNEQTFELADDLGIIRGHGGDLHVSLPDLTPFAESVLTRYARPTIQPVPVSERLPGPEDCDAEGRCWWFVPEDEERPSGWDLDGQPPAREIRFYGNTHWLPHHALPTPTP